MKKLFLFLVFVSFGLIFSSPQLGAHTDDPTRAVAEVLGQKITEQELNRALGPDLYEMQKRMHQLRESKLDELIAKIVLEKEASRQKLTVQQLLEKNVEKKKAGVKQKDINDFYEKNKAHLKGTREQYEERIRSFLEQEKYRGAYSNYLGRLKKQARVKTLLEKPERYRVQLSLTESPRMGSQG